ncbi:MAG: thioredoxin [Propionibacterium sp.]|nr:thioredoxin [Propionibacterium sp.]
MAKVVACAACGTKNRVPAVAKGSPGCASCKAKLPWLVDARDADFDDVIDTGQLVVVDLWAPWCGPCRMISPVLEQLSVEFAGRVKVVKVNVDENPAVSTRYAVQSIPLVKLLRGGREVDTLLGAQPPQAYRQRIEAALG